MEIPSNNYRLGSKSEGSVSVARYIIMYIKRIIRTRGRRLHVKLRASELQSERIVGVNALRSNFVQPGQDISRKLYLGLANATLRCSDACHWLHGIHGQILEQRIHMGSSLSDRRHGQRSKAWGIMISSETHLATAASRPGIC